MTGGFLERMADSSRQRCLEAQRRLSASELKRRVDDLPPPATLAFSPQGFDLIAEIKPRSPSGGQLAQGTFSPAALAKKYVSAGAMALSVLTEPSRFDGSLTLLAEVAATVSGRPVMRKDFLVDPYQVLEARLHGAGGVLLIVGMTADHSTQAMLETAMGCGMFALLEAFDEAELDRAQQIIERVQAPRDRALLGLNCRDLRTLKVDPGRFLGIRPRKRSERRMFAESGIDNTRQAAELGAHGWSGLLIGTALMRAADPGALARSILAAGRRQP